MKKIVALLILTLAILVLSMESPPNVEEFLKIVYNSRYLGTYNYTSVLKSEDSDACKKGWAWMNLLYFERSKESYENCDDKFSSVFILRLKALMKDKSSYSKYVSNLTEDDFGKAERLFLDVVVNDSDNVSELRSLYKSTKNQVIAFEYLYALSKKEPEEALKEANLLLRGRNEIIVDYNYSALKGTYYPIILLTSHLLYERAVSGIEEVFKMKLEKFLKLDDKELQKLVFNEMMFGDTKKFRSIHLMLQNAINLLAYNSNDFIFLSSLKDTPGLGILNMSFGEFLYKMKRLAAILKTD